MAHLLSIFFTGVRFALVGIVATAVHLTVVLVVIAMLPVSPIIANTCGFLTAFFVSFSGNYLWTFKAPGQPQKAMQRYLVISVTAFVANTILFVSILQWTSIKPSLAAVFAATLVPIATFLGSRYWGFKVNAAHRQ